MGPPAIGCPVLNLTGRTRQQSPRITRLSCRRPMTLKLSTLHSMCTQDHPGNAKGRLPSGNAAVVGSDGSRLDGVGSSWSPRIRPISILQARLHEESVSSIHRLQSPDARSFFGACLDPDCMGAAGQVKHHCR